MAQKKSKAKAKSTKAAGTRGRPQAAPRPKVAAAVAEPTHPVGEDAPPTFRTLLEAAKWIREERAKGRQWRVVRTGGGWIAKPL